MGRSLVHLGSGVRAPEWIPLGSSYPSPVTGPPHEVAEPVDPIPEDSMPEFRPGETITTPDPTVTVEVSADNPLPVGRHTFQLVVVDDAGNRSQPARVQIVVLDDQAPTAILTAQPARAPAGTSIVLDGRRSTDIGGSIAAYEWTLVD